MCSHLCLLFWDRVGEKVGKTVVDMFGDKVMATTMHGDTWRIKHDTVKMELNRLCVWSSLPSTCEVFGLFSHLIPQKGLSRIERGRKRQGAFGEGSEDLQLLCKVNAMRLSRGRQGTDDQLGIVVGQVRRMLITASIRAQAFCLLYKDVRCG